MCTLYLVKTNLFCGVHVFAERHERKIPFQIKEKKSSHSLKHLVYKNWSDKFKTQQVIYKFKLNNTQKPCTVSHYTCRTIYCETHKHKLHLSTQDSTLQSSVCCMCFFVFFPFSLFVAVKLHWYIFQIAVVRPAKYFSVKKDKWPLNCPSGNGTYGGGLAH